MARTWSITRGSCHATFGTAGGKASIRPYTSGPCPTCRWRFRTTARPPYGSCSTGNARSIAPSRAWARSPAADVIVLGGGADELARYAAAGVRVTTIDAGPTWSVADASADAVVSVWSAFRGADEAELREADRALRPGGRLLVVHDYGRDDVSRLRGRPRRVRRLDAVATARSSAAVSGSG
jgi:hypothetical protein